MSKTDYNFQVLLLIIAVILGIAGICSVAALIMFLTAFF
jgi:hypothetical protein